MSRKLKETVILEEQVNPRIVYLVHWGFYSTHDCGLELSAIYSTRERATAHIKEEEKFDRLKRVRNRKTNKLEDCWSDGDYWIQIVEAHIDSPSWSYSKEQWDADLKKFE